MDTKRKPVAGPGFTQFEAVAVLAVCVGLAGLIAVMGEGTRRQARLGEDIAKFQRIGSWTTSYGADNQDQFWTFSWKKGVSYSMLSGAPWPVGATDLQATANQAIDLLQRAGRWDILAVQAWFPHTMYSHLPLQQHVGADFPDITFVSSGDRRRLQWARDPSGFELGLYQPSPWDGTNGAKRWPYSSSFQLASSMYDLSANGQRVSQGSTHSNYLTPALHSLGGRFLSEASWPSQKVHLYDAVSWHFAPRVSHSAYAELRSPLLFCDGSVTVRATSEANPGWQPNSPQIATPTSYSYSPSALGWEQPTLSGAGSEVISAGRFRWTRGGIAGRDFGGPEVCTGQPGCP